MSRVMFCLEEAKIRREDTTIAKRTKTIKTTYGLIKKKSKDWDQAKD